MPGLTGKKPEKILPNKKRILCIMDYQKREILSLLALLDDEDIPASYAMAELLQRQSPDLLQAICEHQGCSNPRLRKRIHQLESIIMRQSKRKELQYNLTHDSMDLLKGCLKLHLNLFENDSEQKILRQWEKLKNLYRSKHIHTLQEMAGFLQDQGFCCKAYDEFCDEHYCIGHVLEKRTGSDLMLSVIACLLAEDMPRYWHVAFYGGYLGFSNHLDGVIFPSLNWQHVPRTEYEHNCTPWSHREIFRFIAAKLYFCAVGSGLFRNVYTQGLNMAAIAGTNDISQILPYINNAQHLSKK